MFCIELLGKFELLIVFIYTYTGDFEITQGYQEESIKRLSKKREKNSNKQKEKEKNYGKFNIN